MSLTPVNRRRRDVGWRDVPVDITKIMGQIGRTAGSPHTLPNFQQDNPIRLTELPIVELRKLLLSLPRHLFTNREELRIPVEIKSGLVDMAVHLIDWNDSGGYKFVRRRFVNFPSLRWSFLSKVGANPKETFARALGDSFYDRDVTSAESIIKKTKLNHNNLNNNNIFLSNFWLIIDYLEPYDKIICSAVCVYLQQFLNHPSIWPILDLHSLRFGPLSSNRCSPTAHAGGRQRARSQAYWHDALASVLSQQRFSRAHTVNLHQLSGGSILTQRMLEAMAAKFKNVKTLNFSGTDIEPPLDRASFRRFIQSRFEGRVEDLVWTDAKPIDMKPTNKRKPNQ
eukprot:GHVS01086721.1.p1 GENE.GHVS01086721.1~~GHVS01086721.1.p1  ORF type:complete len:394 (+),score=44.74 GHVS01086721.1:168-1184(+)